MNRKMSNLRSGRKDHILRKNKNGNPQRKKTPKKNPKRKSMYQKKRKNRRKKHRSQKGIFKRKLMV